MTDDERLEQLLRSALTLVCGGSPSRDLWPLIVGRRRTDARWLWLDIGLAAAAAMALLTFPDWLWLLVYHL